MKPGTVSEMTKDFFVMLNSQSGELLVPLMDGDELAMFETSEQAHAIASRNVLGEAFGFEVFERGGGI